MPNKIGEAILVIKANAKGLKAGLDKAQKATGGAVKGMQAKFQGFANRIPVVGGALAGLATPAGAATAAIGLTVGVLTGMVKKTLDLGRSLGTARETLGVSAEAIQIYRRAIEETNGSAESFDSSVLRLTRSIGEAGTGNKQYGEDFERIGLSYDDLAKMSPEDALKAVTGAINEQLSPADGAAVKARLLGRGYAGMGGFANLTTAEIEELTDSVADSAVVMGGDAVTSVDEYDASMRQMRDAMGKAAITIGQKIVPALTWLINAAMRVGPAVGKFISIPFKVARFQVMTALKGIVFAWNNTIGRIPGVAKIDIAAITEALKSLGAVAEEDLTPSLEEATTATDSLTAASRESATQMRDTKQAVADWYQELEDAEAGISGIVLPTLEELIALQDEEAKHARVNAKILGQIALDRALAAKKAGETARAEWKATAETARISGEEVAEAARLAAEKTKQETDRINSSWETFRVNQDEVIQAMNEGSVRFEDVVVALADQFGISTTEMANRAAAMGVQYGDTMAFMEAFGREKIAGIVAQLAALKAATETTIGSPVVKGPRLNRAEFDAYHGNLDLGNIAQANRIRLNATGGGAGPKVTVNGDVYGYDDFVDKVGQAGVDLNERGG